MDVAEKRAVIKHLLKKGMNTKEIHNDMLETLDNDCPSYTMIKKWILLFKQGRTSTGSDPIPGKPCTATSEQNVEAVHRMVMTDRRMTIQHIAETLGFSIGSVHTILKKKLHMKKLSARWVLRMLTPYMKQKRLYNSRVLLQRLQEDRVKYFDRIVTQDETWVHHFDPETKQQSMMWKHMGSQPPRKFKRVPSAGKVMASVIGHSQGIIMIDYLERRHTITGQYYAQELRQLREAI